MPSLSFKTLLRACALLVSLIALALLPLPALAQAALDITAKPATGGGQVYSVPVPTTFAPPFVSER